MFILGNGSFYISLCFFPPCYLTCPGGSFGVILLYKAKATTKRPLCALLAAEVEVVDESTLLTWGYGTGQR